MARGNVVPLTAEQRVQRALYLIGCTTLDTLDEHVRKAGAPQTCPDGYYLLKDHNGGKDPTAPDPFDRWTKPGGTQVNRTADCIGGASWIGGWDRYQPQRFAHIYNGWINTDSMRQDAGGRAWCFRRLKDPEPGCYVVCASGSPGHRVGHIGTVIAVPADWDRTMRASWLDLKVVDVASRGAKKANDLTTGRGWFGADAWFIVSTMTA
jgi:hypothetical protein